MHSSFLNWGSTKLLVRRMREAVAVAVGKDGTGNVGESCVPKMLSSRLVPEPRLGCTSFVCHEQGLEA
jgi:hypothetical protein